MDAIVNTRHSRAACNMGKLTGQKPPLKLKETWTIRIRLQLAKEVRGMAMFNLAIEVSCAAAIW